MVRRDRIKILELKTKGFPLLVSMLLHMAILFAFAGVNHEKENHEKERIFTIELMVQDLEYNARLKSKNTSTRMENISNRKINLSKTDLKKEGTDVALPAPAHEPLKEKAETEVIDTHKAEALLGPERPSSLKSADIPSVDPLFLPLVKGDEGEFSNIHSSIISGRPENGFSEKGGGDSIAKVNNSRKDIMEGDFGSINGPSFLKMVKPEYPRLARRLGKEGKVVLSLFIDEHGRLLNVEVIEKAGFGFDEATINAVKASAFRPAILNGVPVACKAVLPVRFKLE